MKKAILIYNPKAGNRQIIEHLDYIIKRIQNMNYEISIYRSEGQGKIEEYIIDHVNENNVDLIIISGGDGTINECINGLSRKKIHIPIGILPLGTANDFAHTLKIPQNIMGALDIIQEGQLRYVDIGKVNDRYFANVCNMGLFSGVSHIIDLDLKKKFGKFAYYVKGIEELQNYQAMKLKIKLDNEVLEGSYVLVLIFNGKGAGGFMKLAKHATVDDGEFDIIGIKDVGLHEIPILFLKVLQGEHFDDSNVDYKKSKHVFIECENMNKEFVTDIDGEKGPSFPLDVDVVEDKFKFFLPYSSKIS